MSPAGTDPAAADRRDGWLGGVGPLTIDSDLVLTVGSAQVNIVATGRNITISTDDTAQLMANASAAVAQLPGPSISARTLAARAGQLLDDAGLRAQVVGQGGTLLELGRGCRSTAGRLLIGSDHVRLGRPTGLARTGVDYVRTSPRARRGVGIAVAAIAAVVLGGRLSRSVRATGQVPAPAERA